MKSSHPSKTYASVVSRTHTTETHPHITPDADNIRSALQEFTSQFRELNNQLTAILQQTTNQQLHLEKFQQELENQNSQLQQIQNCLPLLDTPINQQTHIPRHHKSTCPTPSTASPTAQITKTTHPSVNTADTNSSPTSNCLSKELSNNHQFFPRNPGKTRFRVIATPTNTPTPFVRSEVRCQPGPP